ncbi:MAG TPA: thioesterase family protein [Nitrososphaerales archaeon]|nr:thioesterase family protein [Nitrososphaerales archaeon]
MKFVVPFSDVDMMGHVNNARYLTYFENVRTEHLYTETSVDDLGIIIARAEVDYKSPARWQEELLVKMRTVALGTTSWVYEYEILAVEDGRTIATGKTVQVVYDYKSKTPVAIPDKYREILKREIEETKDPSV